MNKFIKKIAALAIMLMCGINANAQLDLSDILGTVVSGVTGSSSSSSTSATDIISSLTSVFSSSKQASTNKLIGTWEYSEPAIVFTSDNLLAKAGSKLVSNKIESKLQSTLDKYGISKGSMSVTFNEDGTFTETLAGKTLSGKWSVSNQKLSLTYGGIKTVNITTQLDGSNLQIVTDASKLLSLTKSLGAKSSNSTISTVTSLMKSVNGMKAGITLVKK